MSFKRLTILAIIFAFSLSNLAYSSQNKNRIVIAEGDKIKLFEFNATTKEFDSIWESAETGTGIKSVSFGIRGMALEDIDGDGKNELVAIDQFGIFVWGKAGKIPHYYNLKNAVSRIHWSYIVPVDLDKDGVFEFVTQRTRVGYGERQIGAWKIQGNELTKMSEIELPGGISWSLRLGDCDNDETEDILTSSGLIHVLGWEETEGFFEKARFPNLSQVVDVVHVGDVDGDGTNEIVASGSSGCFTVYKARKHRETGIYFYPVVYQSERLVEGRGGLTQGLEIADIDGDGDNEVLIGVTSTSPKDNNHNVFVYEYVGGETRPGRVTYMMLKKVFSMSLESSSIPGFVIGDADNDGQNEVIYNNKYVLKFSRDADNHLDCSVIATLVDKASASLIGPFDPEGKDESKATRIVPQNLFVELKSGDIIESGKIYKFWIKLNSPWTEAQNVKVHLDSLTEKIAVLNGEFSLSLMEAGNIYDNKEYPFLVKPGDIAEETRFGLKVEISAENGYQLTKIYSMVRSSDESMVRSSDEGDIPLEAVPKIVVTSDSLGISSEEDVYKDLGISYDYFSDYYGLTWPPIEILLKYKNLLTRIELATMSYQINKLKAYLDAGGNCLVHGDNVVDIREGNSKKLEDARNFVTEYFHTKYVKDFEGEKVIEGKSDDSISNGIKFQLKGSQYGDLPDVLETLPGAIPIFFFPSGEVAGVRIEGKYKMVYLGFSLEDIQQTEVKKELVQRILAWFNQE